MFSPEVPPPARLNYTAARVSVSTFFFLMGLSFASWASRIPDIQENLQLSAGELGSILLGMPLGSLVALAPAGWLVTKLGSRKVTFWALVAYVAALPLLGLMTSGWQLAAALFLYGAAGDVSNIAVNTQVVNVERGLGKPIMSSCHGLFSIGAFAGSALGGIAVSLRITPLYHFLAVLVLSVIMALVSARALLSQDHKQQTSTEKTPLFVWPDRALLLLGLIAFCCMLTEGAMADWSSIYYRQRGGNVASLGYTAFTITMAAGRFMGDWLTVRLGIRKMLQISGLGIAVGMALAVSAPFPWAVIIGFLIIGFGVAVVVPLVYSEAGRSATMSAGIALAAVSTVGYTGFLMGPPLIGFVAEAATLRIALSIVIVLGFTIWLLARRVRH
ncbi:MFS transporter [Siphonobacter sp. BAB-5405]|uniref:MFS transporter n=1 Tax=Siphonobacter sp. BAB-5405 TaxID=1864825 RepID=UPI000C8102E4|nr:MFS transporter [Siphonobacter sp. BAB-5405]PMD95590.1 MFS transporter [Siphonobacter sp. BAB-5405]